MKYQKGFVSMVLIGVVIVLVAIGGYFVLSKKSNQSNNSKTSTATSTSANWKTYNNSKYGFEFQYPENWVISNCGTEKSESLVIYFNADKYCDVNSDHDISATADIFINKDNLDNRLKNLTVGSGIFSTSTGDSVQDITIGNNIGAKRLNGKYLNGIIFGYKNYVYDINLQGISEKDSQIFNKVLSTFKFTQQTQTNTSKVSTACKDIQEGMPVIISLSTYSAKIGDTIKIHGCNLNGLEGDKRVYIENSQGVSGLLEQYDVTNDPENMQVTLTPTVCSKYVTDVTCKEWFTLSPGVYKIFGTLYHAPSNGKRSNEVTFTIK